MCPGGGGIPYITDGVARRNFQKQPLNVTILGVAPANFISSEIFIHRNNTIIAKGQQVLL